MNTTENIIRKPRSTPSRPENDFEGEVLLTGEKTDLKSRLLSTLSKLTGSSEEEIGQVLGVQTKYKPVNYPQAKCHECGRRYRIFTNYDPNMDQDVCPACKDEEMEATRRAQQGPERLEAKKRMLQEAEKIESEKAVKQNETAQLAAQTAAQVVAQMLEAQKRA